MSAVSGHAKAAQAEEIGIPDAALSVFVDPVTGDWLPSRYKILYGGRGGAKSETVARILLQLARCEDKAGILCTRMFQNSIADSVYRTLEDAAIEMGIADEFDWQKTTIIHRASGSWFIFKGIQRDLNSIKSLKGVKYCWVEEAEPVPDHSWRVLRKTLRMEGSCFIITFNPDDEMSATYQTFVVKARSDMVSRLVNYYDNPFFPDVLEQERLRDWEAAMDGEGNPSEMAAYEWVWLGKPRKITDAVIFRNRVFIEPFDEPPEWPVIRWRYGVDWGFADDPTTMIRFYVDNETRTLYISHEMFTWHTELDDLPACFETVPGSRKWPIKADNARPETISYIHRQRFSISAADKWPGSVEDGIAHMKAYARIVIHPRCTHTAREFRLYSYKVDPKQVDEKGDPVILPIIVDKHNHGIDAIRYGLDGEIKGKGGLKISSAAMDKARARR